MSAAPDDAGTVLAGSDAHLEIEGRRTSIGEAGTRAVERLTRTGLGAGDVIALSATRTPESLALMTGAWRARLLVLPVAPEHPPRRVTDLVARAAARMLVDPAARSLDTPTPRAPIAGHPAGGTILETSGSSGRAKLVVHGLSQHLASARTAAEVLGLGPGDRWLLSLPIHHVGGLGIVVRALVTGATVVLPRAGEQTVDAVRRTRPSFISVVARQLDQLLADAGACEALAGARVVLAGGGPIPYALRMRAIERGVPLHVSYGSTETASLVAVSGDPAVVVEPDAAGRALPGCTLTTDDDGILHIASPTLLSGYLEAGRVVAAVGPEGTFDTRDRGYVDAAGVVHITARTDLAFVSGGENVDPLEVEAVLLAHDAVAEAVVVSVSDASWGRRPVAFVRPRPGCRVTGGELVRLIDERLPRHARPDAFYALPVHAGIKPDRTYLASLAESPEALAPL